MPIIYSYPPTSSISNNDTFIITKEIEDENRIETRSITYEKLKEKIKKDIIVEDTTFIFEQGVASAIWNITHNLKKFPSVNIVDTQENTILGFITEYIDNNNVKIKFLTAFAGKAYLN